MATAKQKAHRNRFKSAVRSCKGKTIKAFRACVSAKLRK